MKFDYKESRQGYAVGVIDAPEVAFRACLEGPSAMVMSMMEVLADSVDNTTQGAARTMKTMPSPRNGDGGTFPSMGIAIPFSGR